MNYRTIIAQYNLTISVFLGPCTAALYPFLGNTAYCGSQPFTSPHATPPGTGRCAAGQHLLPGPSPLMISGLLTIQKKLNYFLRTSFTHLQSLDLDFPLSPLPSFSLVFRGCPSLHYLWSSHSPMRVNLVSSCRKKSEAYSRIPNY